MKKKLKNDKLFGHKKKKIMDFNFGKDTAVVFDDMLERSIPLYWELQKMIGQLANEFAIPGTHIYDLGCSTGITLETIYHAVKKDVILIGIDYSQDMLNLAQKRFQKQIDSGKVKLICGDLNNGISIHNASVVILNLTLQFIRPLNRDMIIQDIYNGLNDKGCLIVVEKVLGNESTINRIFIKFYYDMKKRNGYSDMEIAQKREALENILIPYRFDENKELFKKNGFKNFDIFYKWYNFCGMLAYK